MSDTSRGGSCSINNGEVMTSEDIAKIRIKLGTLEIDYEGKSNFITDSLTPITEKLVELYRTCGNALNPQAKDVQSDIPPSNDNAHQLSDNSTSTFATLIGADNGPALVKAAAANLTFTQRKDKFKREELMAEMKNATSFYKKSYISNLSAILARLVKEDEFRHIGENVYALSNKVKQQFEQKLVA